MTITFMIIGTLIALVGILFATIDYLNERNGW